MRNLGILNNSFDANWVPKVIIQENIIIIMAIIIW